MGKSELSAILGVGPKSIVIWQSEGLPFTVAENGNANEYNTAEVIRWMIKRETKAVGALVLNDEKANLAKEQAEYARLKNEEKRGNLIPLTQVVYATQKAAAAIRQKIVNAPMQAADKQKLLEEIHGLKNLNIADIRDAANPDEETDEEEGEDTPSTPGSPQ